MASRREFFKTLASPIAKKQEKQSILYLRPPYYNDINIFDKECINCESKACAEVCEESIIVIEANNTPILNFTNSGCSFCQECAEVCEANVLRIEDKKDKINAIITINKDKCMSHHGSICFSCKEPCLDEAILFKGMFEPIIDLEKCTSCGFCIGRCPTNAIEYIIKEQ